MKTMTHKGYSAVIQYNEENGCFVGHIARMPQSTISRIEGLTRGLLKLAPQKKIAC